MAPAKLQVKIGGMACSFCVETIRKGLGRTEGVVEVNVSLAHEEALIAYDPARVTPAALTATLRSLGYTVRDPNKVRTVEEDAAELARERDRLVIAGAAAWIGFMVMLLMWVGRHHPLAHWFMAALALLMVFGSGLYILRMAVVSVTEAPRGRSRQEGGSSTVAPPPRGTSPPAPPRSRDGRRRSRASASAGRAA